MKKILLISALLLLPTLAQAQTVKLAWQFNNSTPAEVATYNQVVTMDSVVVPGVPTCAVNPLNAAQTNCEISVGTVANGPHTFGITTTFESVERSTIVNKTFPLTGGNAQPINPKFTITIIISGN